MTYDYQPFPYTKPPGLTAPEPRHKVIIVGAGPIGLAAALELARHGVASVVLDDNDVVSVGSRAICWSKRSLEILDRLGLGEAAAKMGVTWQVGRTYHRDAEVFSFDLQPEAGQKMPAFVNLQQYHVEEMLAQKALTDPLVDLRFKNQVVALERRGDHVHVGVETPDGTYALTADYLVACDGAKSPIRSMMGLDFEGELFEERFLIADIEMPPEKAAELPAERRFWFEPTFHTGQSALLHKQPDNIYRIDLQLGWDADPEAERRPDRVTARIARVVGHEDFRLDWVSVYTFQCRRLAQFVHGRVIFAGDSAHIVSPFGARGGNSGMQDVDALGWRLAAVAKGAAKPALLAAYGRERQAAADENIRHSARTTRFMTPADGVERQFRDAVLADDPALPALSRPGSVAPDAPLGEGWLLNALGRGPVLLTLGCAPPEGVKIPTLSPDLNATMRKRYLGDAAQALYLIRPDQVVAARWTKAKAGEIKAELAALWEGPE